MRNVPRFALILLPLLATAQTLEFKQRCLKDLAAAVPGILASQDPKTGRFGTGIWICNDQNVVFPLAAAWAWKDASNPWYHKAELLEAIMKGGDALIDDQDAEGRWEFRKKDGSTWGPIHMPWTYSRWIRAYTLIRDGMPRARRERWEKGLLLGYSGIARKLETDRLHNIPAHHAMGVYFAGKAFDRPKWMALASDFLRRIAASQQPDGYWSEGKGPVVLYGFVYVDALGIYHAVSGDDSVLPVLAKSGLFHSYFTYPDGSDVETIDERNPYHPGVRAPNPGLTATAEGRAYSLRQLRLFKEPLGADEAAALLFYGKEGKASAELSKGDFDYALPSGQAAVHRRGPWFLSYSAFTAPVPNSRWQQDRQNFVSVFHDKTGLILGGGNTKLQPGWSSFTFGDIALLFHRPGEINPDFTPRPGLLHVPGAAKLHPAGVDLDYDGRKASIRTRVESGSRLVYTVSSPDGGGAAAAAHLTVLPAVGEPVRCQAGNSEVLGGKSFAWKEPGEWIEHRGARLYLPRGAAVRWPALPHDPYKKDGRSEPAQGRLAVDLPFTPDRGEYEIILEIR